MASTVVVMGFQDRLLVTTAVTAIAAVTTAGLIWFTTVVTAIVTAIVAAITIARLRPFRLTTIVATVATVVTAITIA
ncbi:hypothetical protein BGZ96_003617, partial [Linnemannia gamsii]